MDSKRGTPDECLGHFPRRPLVELTCLVTAFGCLIFRSWKEVKVIALPETGKDLKFLENLRQISLLSPTGELLEKDSLGF
jgi:hypothetical protein